MKIFILIVLFAVIALVFGEHEEITNCSCVRIECPGGIRFAGCPRVGCKCYRPDGVLMRPPQYWPNNLPRNRLCRPCPVAQCQDIRIYCDTSYYYCDSTQSDYVPDEK